MINVSPVVDSTEGRGIRTPLDAFDTLLQNNDKSTTENTQTHTNPDTYKNSQNTVFKQFLTVHKQCLDTLLHIKCALCVPKHLPDDLRAIIKRWPDLPENIRESIMLLVTTNGQLNNRCEG